MTDISQSNWSETDGSNNQVAPNGAPEGMAPSGVNDTMRMMMGGVKRFWDRINGTVKTTNVGAAYTYAPTVVAPALVDGEIYTFRANAANTGAATLNVGVGGAKPLVKSDGITGATNLSTNDILPGIYYMAAWDSLAAQFVVLNSGLATVPAGSISADVNAAIRSTSFAIKTDLGSVSSVLSLRIESVSAVAIAAIRSTSAVVKVDITSVGGVITTAFAAADRSTSSAIKTDISSVGSVIATAFAASDRSTSAAVKTYIDSVSATIVVGYTAADRSTSSAIKTYIDSVSAALKTAINTAAIPVGSKMFFYNNAAPTGWTFTSLSDYTIIVQGTVSDGGTTGGAWTISGISLNDTNHTHAFSGNTGVGSADIGVAGGGFGVSVNTHFHGYAGTTSGESDNHSHVFDGAWRPKHLKVIMCTKA